MGRKRKIPIDPEIAIEREEIKRKPRNKKKEERLFIGHQNRWKIKEKMALLTAVREFGVDFCPAMGEAVRTKNKAEIIDFLRVYKLRANALQTPKSEAQSPFDPWMRVMENILSPLKDQSKMYIELLDKLEDRTPAAQSSVFPPTPSYKNIYGFLKNILLGKVPDPLPPLESSIVLDLLRHLANLIKTCDMSVQRSYMASQYPNLVVDPIGTAAKKQDNAILDILGYGPKKPFPVFSQTNQNLNQSRPVKILKRSHLLYRTKVIPIKQTTTLTQISKDHDPIPPEAVLMDIKMIKKPSGQIDYVLPEQFPVTKESLKILQNFATQSFLSPCNNSQSNYRILKIASYKTPVSEKLPPNNKPTTGQITSDIKIMSGAKNQSNQTSCVASISTAKPTSQCAVSSPTSGVSPLSTAKAISTPSLISQMSGVSPVSKGRTLNKIKLVSQSGSTSHLIPVNTGTTVSKPSKALSNHVSPGKINKAAPQSQVKSGVSISKSGTPSSSTSGVTPASLSLPSKAVSFILPVSSNPSKTAVIAPIPCGTYIIKLASSGTTVRKVSSVVTSLPSDIPISKTVTTPGDTSVNKVEIPSSDTSVSKSSVIKLSDVPVTKALKSVAATSVVPSNDLLVVPSVLCGSSISKAISVLLSQSTSVLSGAELSRTQSMESPVSRLTAVSNNSPVEPPIISSLESSVSKDRSLSKVKSVSTPLQNKSFPAYLSKCESSLNTSNTSESKDSIILLPLSSNNKSLESTLVKLPSSDNLEGITPTTTSSGATLASSSDKAVVAQPSNVKDSSVTPASVSLSSESSTMTSDVQIPITSTSFPSQSSNENNVEPIPEDPEYVRLAYQLYTLNPLGVPTSVLIPMY